MGTATCSPSQTSWRSHNLWEGWHDADPNQTLTRGDPPLRGGGKSTAAIVAMEGRTNKKASRCEGPKDQTEPTKMLEWLTKERTKQL